MKQYGLRFLYKHLGQAVKELPFEITNHNKVIAVVSAPDVKEDVTYLSEKSVARIVDRGIEVFNRKTGKWEAV